MAELATLGVEVQPVRGADQATQKLKQLAGAAKMAEQAANGLASSKQLAAGALANARASNAQAAAALASAKASGTASQADIQAARSAKLKAASVLAAANADYKQEAASYAAARAASEQANAALRAAQAESKMVAANQNIAAVGKASGAASHNVANLAAQFQDVAVTAAMGMSPLQIALQQGTQLSSVLGPMGAAGAVRTLGAAFLSVLSPVSLFVIGVTALAAAGLQMVNWTKLAASALTGLADSLSIIAPYAVAAAAALAVLYGPAIVGGILGLTAYLVGVGIAAAQAAAAFALAWYSAAAPLTLTLTGIAAVGAAVHLLRDEIKKALGIDVVDVFKTAGNTMIAVFVGTVDGIREKFSILPAALGDLMVRSANAVIGGVESLVNGVAERIDAFIARVNGALSKLPGGGLQLGTIGTVDLPEVPNPWSGKASEVGGSINDKIMAASRTDWMGGIGSAIGDGASYASGKLKELAGWMTTVDDKSKKKKGGRGAKTEAERYDDIIDGANRRIARLQAEQSAIGMTEEAAAALRYETDLLNQAQQKGITLTSAQKGELSGLAATMASIEAATEKAKEAIDFAKETTRGFVDDFVTGLKNGEGAWKSFANAAMNALSRIGDKLLDQAFDGLFSGGGGGFLSSLFGGGSSSFAALPSIGPIPATRPFASGGYTGNAAAHVAAGIVHGGEYVFSKKATDRIGVRNLESMHKRAKGYDRGGHVSPLMPANNNSASSSTMSFSYAPVYHVQGSGPEITQLRQDMARDKATFEARVVRAVRDKKEAGWKGL
jgi:hypothetical protein